MGRKLKKKAHKQKKTSQKNYDNGRIDWGLGVRSSQDSESESESFQNEDELSGMNLLSSDVPAIYPFGKDESDSEQLNLLLWVNKKDIKQRQNLKGFQRKSEINKIY